MSSFQDYEREEKDENNCEKQWCYRQKIMFSNEQQNDDELLNLQQNDYEFSNQLQIDSLYQQQIEDQQSILDYQQNEFSNHQQMDQQFQPQQINQLNNELEMAPVQHLQQQQNALDKLNLQLYYQSELVAQEESLLEKKINLNNIQKRIARKIKCAKRNIRGSTLSQKKAIYDQLQESLGICSNYLSIAIQNSKKEQT